jgi:hypothetical protein
MDCRKSEKVAQPVRRLEILEENVPKVRGLAF